MIVNNCMYSILLTTILVGLVKGQSAAWPNIETGKTTPILTFSGSQANLNQTFSLTHNNTNTGAVASLALIGYDALLSTSFSFNTTILTISNTTLDFSVQTYNTTYFNLLSYHYMITTHSTIQIHNLCYYTSSLYTSNGSRSISYNNATTAFNGSYLTLSTVLTGFKVENSQGSYLLIRASSTVNNYTITTVILTEDYNLVEWACVSVIAYEGKTLTGQFYQYKSSIASNASGLTNLLQNDPAFLLPNVMFFGLSQLKLNLFLSDKQIFKMNTDNTADPLSSPEINENQEEVWVEQFYIWTDACINTSTNMVPLTGYTCTNTCNSLQYNNSNQYCFSCTIQNANCLTCDQTNCLTCDANAPAYRVLDTINTPNTCICLTNYFQLNGTCTLCSIYLSYCVTCVNETTCTACDTGFTPENGICVCNVNTYLINGTCIPLKGCLNYYQITNAYYCSQCDASNYFQLIANQTCECMINTVYNNITGMCEGNCSDGASLGNFCDLGAQNGVTGSGCAANCTVVDGYYCSNPSTTSPSICVLRSNYTGSYLYVTKELTSNTANIYVQLSPNDAFLSQMDFSSLVTTSIPTTAIACSFDSSTGILKIQATYSETIEGTSQMVNISFDPTVTFASSVQLYPTLNSGNSRLQFGTFQSYNNIVFYFSTFVGVFSIIFSIVSSILGYKMYGFQICLPVQVAYFTLCLLHLPYSAISSLYGLNFSNGYNQLESFRLLNNLNLDSGLIVIQRTTFFLQNCNFTYILLAILILLALLTRCCIPDKEEQGKKNEGSVKKKKKKEEEVSKDAEEVKEVGRGEKAHYFIVDKLLVNGWVVLLLLAVFSFGIQIQTTTYTSKYSFNLNIAAGGVVLLVELGGMMFITLKIKEKDKNVTFRSHSRFYPLLYIFTQLLVIIFIVCTFFATEYAIFLLVLPQIVVVFFYIKLSPHGKFKSFINITGLYLQLIPLYATFGFILMKYLSSPLIATTLAFSLLGLFLIGGGFSIARLIVKYKEDQTKLKENLINQKVKLEESNLEAMTYSSIKKQLMNNTTDRKLNWEAINESKVELSPNQQGKISAYQKEEEKEEKEEEKPEQDEEENEEDELRKLKMRLKKEIFEKRTYNL